MKQSVEEKIKQRRLQILVHSCIYYKYNENIISDAKWNEWAKELVELQKQYPKESKLTIYAKDFQDFDGSTGFNLPIHDDNIQRVANILLNNRKSKTIVNKSVKKKTSKSKISSRRLF